MKKKIILISILFLFVLGYFGISASVKAATSSRCRIRVNNHCYTGPKRIKRPTTSGGCRVVKDKYKIGTCNANPDYWVSAIRACGGLDKLPPLEDLMAISSAIHTKYNEFDENLIEQWGLKNVKYLWSNREDYGSCEMNRRIKDCIAKRDPKTTDLETQTKRCEFISNFRGHFCAEDESGAMAMDIKNTFPTAIRSGFVVKKRFEHLHFICKVN